MSDIIKDLANEVENTKTRVIISLQGEAAVRLLMWAESQHLHKNVAARIMLEEGMVEKGLLLRKNLRG